MLPLEFTVLGTPVSHQSRNKRKLVAWRHAVRSAAARVWRGRSPLEINLIITLTYYHEGETVRIDNDNLLKPIQDALIGLVYRDDRWITDIEIRKTSIDGRFRVRGHSLVLLTAFSQGHQFLHIVVDRAPSHENPLK
jgi:crossover junction endodeoxyribonuclease RusA